MASLSGSDQSTAVMEKIVEYSSPTRGVTLNVPPDGGSLISKVIYAVACPNYSVTVKMKV